MYVGRNPAEAYNQAAAQAFAGGGYVGSNSNYFPASFRPINFPLDFDLPSSS
jgi:hypothetical protein